MQFPIDVFPKKVQKIFLEYKRCYNTPVDYSALSLIISISSIILNKLAISYNLGRGYQTMKPIFYSQIVGYSGIGKTATIQHAKNMNSMVAKNLVGDYNLLYEATKKKSIHQDNNWFGEPLENKAHYSIIGGINSGELAAIKTDKLNNVGFLSKVLFAYPDLKEHYFYTGKSVNKKFIKRHQKILQWIVDRVDVVTEQYLTLSDNATLLYKNFIAFNSNDTLSIDDDLERDMILRLNAYCLRLALIFQVLDHCSRFKKIDEIVWEDYEISIESMQSAVDICHYFRHTAKKVATIIQS